MAFGHGHLLALDNFIHPFNHFVIGEVQAGEHIVIMGRKAFLAKRLSLFFALDKIRHRLNQQGICGPLAGCRQIAEPGPQVTRQSHADSAGEGNS